MTYGEIPTGQQVLHHCDNPPCIRPDHLFVGTQLDNVADAYSKGRYNTTKFAHSQRGEDNNFCKLSDKQVADMRKLYDTGQATQAELMRLFGTTRGNVHCIVRRKSRI